jgi:fucose 4-O-acetylase-like acetyltransferase
MGLESVDDSARQAPRNTYLDLTRVVAIAAVVVGHWLATAIVYQHGRLQGVDVLSVVPWTSWLTLIFQAVPVFFLVGGYSNALSWTRHRSAGGSAFGWIRRRALRLLLPTSVYIAVIVLLVVGCALGGINRDDLSQAAWALALHLWFLAVYLALLVLTPALHLAQERYGIRTPVVMAALAVVIDVGVIEAHWHLVGWVNYVLVWGAFHQLGFAWHDGFFAGRRGRPLALIVGAIAALVALIWWGPYPVSMIGVPGARIQNASPPSAALLAFGLAQVGAVLLAEPLAVRLLARPHKARLRALVERANTLTMPVYLWHMVPLVIVTVVGYPTGLLAQPAIGSGAWWAQRVSWLGALTVVLAMTLAIALPLHRASSRKPPAAARTPSTPAGATESVSTATLRLALLTLGVGVTAAGLGRLAVQGFAPDGSLDPTSVAAFALGVSIVGAAGVRRPRVVRGIPR